MAFDDFFSNDLIIKIINDLKNKDIVINPIVKDTEIWKIYDNHIANFTLIIGKDENYLFDILKNDYNGFLNCLYTHLENEKTYLNIFNNLILYTVTKYFPEKWDIFFKSYQKVIYDSIQSSISEFNKKMEKYNK